MQVLVVQHFRRLQQPVLALESLEKSRAAVAMQPVV
jgi:hypothetical protein